MTYSSIEEAIKKGEGPVNLRGWVYRQRSSKKIVFVVLRDSTNIIQCVIERESVGEEVFETSSKLQIESSITVKGNLKRDDRAPTGFELKVASLELIGESHEFPIQKDQSAEFLADNRHLWLRSRKMSAVLKIRSTVFFAIHDYFRSHGFHEFHSPIFQATQAEGGSEVFEVKYFNDKVYLAQTWQLPAEAGIFGLEKIYTISPSFRAEKSKTSRHLTEYWHAEMEEAWADFDTIIDHGEALLKHILKKVLETNQEELAVLERDVSKLIPSTQKKFPRIKYDEAVKILKEKHDYNFEWGNDLRTLEEEKLMESYDTPIIVTHYPKKVKAFYMKEDPENPDVVFGCDFLAPEGNGELIGGSQREEKIEEIQRRLKEQGEDPSEYEFYLDTRRYGSVPHGGFGLGVERVIKWICGLDNIKDAIAFPRTPTRYKP